MTTVAATSRSNDNDPAAALSAFGSADFDWATRLQDVWRDPICDVPEFHAATREAFSAKLAEMRSAGKSRSPLGWIITGSGGSGKTHLLGAMRREAARCRTAFVLVDMTDVRDFWETTLQGYIDSLQIEYCDRLFQHEFLLRNVIIQLGAKDDTAGVLRSLARQKSDDLAKIVNQLLNALRKKYPRETMKHQDVVRALVCLNSSEYEILNVGMAWLQGQEIDDEARRSLGFLRPQDEPRSIVAALSWIMSLGGPTVVAFDQLDPIVHQIGRHHVSDLSMPEAAESGRARAIIEQIGAGLAAMPDVTTNTLAIVSCVETTWALLNEMVLSTYRDRFEEPIRLRPPKGSDAIGQLIAARLAPAYTTQEFTPRYPTWPFHPDMIGELAHNSPREVLKCCENHRKECLTARVVAEITRLTTINEVPEVTPNLSQTFTELEQRFVLLRHQAKPDELLAEKEDDLRLAPLYQTALRCLVHEHEPRLTDEVDAIVETNFSGGKSTRPLHARLRLVFHDEDSREEHYCIRALQRKHHGAYRTRLKAAMTQSGIDKALKFRHLVIVRSGPPPGGTITTQITNNFRRVGGRIHEPSDDELRTLWALKSLLDERPGELVPWLQHRKPVTRLNLPDSLLPASLANREPPRSEPATNVSTRRHIPASAASAITGSTLIPRPAPSIDPIKAVDEPQERAQPVESEAPRPEPPKTRPTPDPSKELAALPLGSRLLGSDTQGAVVALRLPLLAKHTIILGGAGSGKSVTVRRLVEEAGLRGIPSIILDGARDMLSFDERSSTRENQEAAIADQFHNETEMIVWTPGRDRGNPLQLEPLPDFTPLADDPDGRESAVQMAAGGLTTIVAPGKSQKSETKRGILAASLRYFAKELPDAGLDSYIDLLNSLPPEAGIGVKNEGKFAGEMADSLRVEIARNPMLRSGGTSLDPAVLFGDDVAGGRTRISVISLLGLPTMEMQFSFINQLAMLLFSWIKENPRPPGDRPLRGLLVIDEAKDFIPSQRGTACKESLQRLAAQARKYKLGLVLATQHPKDVDTKVVGNCATHFYGFNNSPASLQTLEDLMRQKGGDDSGIARLKAGQFYVYNSDAGHSKPIKIQVPMSLSLSPSNPLDEEQILAKARDSRARIAASEDVR